MLENEDYSAIKMIPFRDLTLPLYNMHPMSSAVGATGATQDQHCTHYCYFPQMWQSVWKYLYEDALASP
jgi:hypothetical protein